MRTVIFHRLAIKEAHQAERYYAARDERAALRFRQALDTSWRRIARDPSSIAYWKPPYRLLRIMRYPYVLFFQEVDDCNIVILALAHTSRRSGYWQRRSAGP